MATRTRKTATPSVEIARVTPKLAEEWLGKNTNNRSVRDKKVATYAAAMKAGEWRLTGEGVKFDSSGRLIDGQHRLMAIIESKVIVEMFVFRDLSADVQMVIDTGAKRSSADALKWAGLTTDPNAHAAMARIAVIWEEGGYQRAVSSSVRREVTNTEVVDWVTNNPDSLEAMTLARTAEGYGPPRSVLAFAALLLLRIDAEDAVEFFARIANLRTRGKGDPIYTLLKRYEQARGGKESLRTPQHLYYIFRAWNAFRDGSSLHQLKIGQAGANGQIAMVLPK